MMSVLKPAMPKFPHSLRPAIMICLCVLGGCATFKPPQISYDNELPPLPGPAALADEGPRPLHVPPGWTPGRGGKKGAAEAKEPVERIESANDAARVQPRKAGYFNAVQVFPFSTGALYQIYASPGQITDIALEPGEQLIGSGPVAAGDTVRYFARVVDNAPEAQTTQTEEFVLRMPEAPQLRRGAQRELEAMSERLEELADRARRAGQEARDLGREAGSRSQQSAAPPPTRQQWTQQDPPTRYYDR